MASRKFILKISKKGQPKNQGKAMKFVLQFLLENIMSPVLRTSVRQCSKKPLKVNVKSKPSNWHINKNQIKKNKYQTNDSC